MSIITEHKNTFFNSSNMPFTLWQHFFDAYFTITSWLRSTALHLCRSWFLYRSILWAPLVDKVSVHAAYQIKSFRHVQYNTFIYHIHHRTNTEMYGNRLLIEVIQTSILVIFNCQIRLAKNWLNICFFLLMELNEGKGLRNKVHWGQKEHNCLTFVQNWRCWKLRNAFSRCFLYLIFQIESIELITPKWKEILSRNPCFQTWCQFLTKFWGQMTSLTNINYSVVHL